MYTNQVYIFATPPTGLLIDKKEFAGGSLVLESLF